MISGQSICIHSTRREFQCYQFEYMDVIVAYFKYFAKQIYKSVISSKISIP